MQGSGSKILTRTQRRFITQGILATVLDVMDVLPVGNLNFLTREQQRRLKEVALAMEPAESKAFVAILKQPGKAADMRLLIERLALQKRQIQELTNLARQLLLTEPALARDRKRLTTRLLDSFRAAA